MKEQNQSRVKFIKTTEASQQELIEAGIHPPFVSIDRTVFKKTEDEKTKVKLAKANWKNNTQFVIV